MPQLLNKRLFQEWLNNSSGFFYSVNRTLHSGRTRFQEIELVQTDEFGNVLLLDGITQVVQKNDWQYHEPMVHPALLAHPDPRTVLVIGGGDGGILREVLRHGSVERVDFAELDEEVIAFCRTHLPDISNGAFDDPRVHTHITDGRAFVERNAARYDAVIMDMTDPFGPSRLLYTREFFAAVRRSFRDDRSVFTMHTESPIARPDLFTTVRRTLASVFPLVRQLYLYIQMYATLWSIAVCSAATDILSVDTAELDRRIADRGLSIGESQPLRMVSGASVHAMLTPFPYLAKLESAEGPIITDADPNLPNEGPSGSQ